MPCRPQGHAKSRSPSGERDFASTGARWLSNADGSIIWRYGDQNMWQRLQELMGSFEASLRDAGEPIGFPTDSMDLYSAYLVPSDDSDTEYQLPERIQLA